MYKVTHTTALPVFVQDMDEAMELYYAAEGLADVFLNVEGDWVMIADGFDFE